MESRLFDELLKGFSFIGALVAIGFGIYFFIKGGVTNGLLALILSCLAFILVIQIAKFQTR